MQTHKCPATINVQGANEGTLAARTCFFSPRTHPESYPDCPTSCPEASFVAPSDHTRSCNLLSVVEMFLKSGAQHGTSSQAPGALRLFSTLQAGEGRPRNRKNVGLTSPKLFSLPYPPKSAGPSSLSCWHGPIRGWLNEAILFAKLRQRSWHGVRTVSCL